VLSVASQTVAPLEHVIVDDGSTDNSREVLTSLAARFPFLRVIFQQPNQGTSVTTHRAMKEAAGDYIFGLAADDTLLPHAIEAFASVISENPDAALVCGELEYCKGEKSWHRRYITADAPVYLSPGELARYQRSMLTVVNGAAIVRRDDALASVLGDARLRWLGDMIGYTIISYRHGLWYVPKIVHRFTIHDNNMSARAQVWKLQKPVVARLFEILQSPDYADVRTLYRDSAALAEVPMILRYMLLRPSTWNFLSVRLVANGFVFWSYRLSRQLVPQRWIDAYINRRSRGLG
jgi:glycosyltransferase involved in cell wall biosynthesis